MYKKQSQKWPLICHQKDFKYFWLDSCPPKIFSFLKQIFSPLLMLMLSNSVLVCCSSLHLSTNHPVTSVSASGLPVIFELQLQTFNKCHKCLTLLNLKGVIMIPKYVLTKSETKKDLCECVCECHIFQMWLQHRFCPQTYRQHP